MKILMAFILMLIGAAAYPTDLQQVPASQFPHTNNLSPSDLIVVSTRPGGVNEHLMVDTYLNFRNQISADLLLGTSASRHDIGGTNFVSVEWYGAKDDGSDCTAIIQSVINKFQQSSTIYFPGSYKISDTITNYGTRDVHLVGVGSGSAVGGPGFYWCGPSNKIPWKVDRSNGQRYDNLHWTVFATNTPVAAISIDQTGPIGWGTMTDFAMKNCTVVSQHTNLNTKFICVMISTNATQNCDQIRFEDCLLRGFGLDWYPATNNSIGLFIGNNANALGIKFKGGAIQNCSVGIMASSGSLTVSDYTFMTGCGTNFVVLSASGPMVFDSVRSEAERMELFVEGSTLPIWVRGCTFQDTSSWSTNSPLVRIDGTCPVKWDNNTFSYSWGQTNFLVTAGAPSFSGTGNTFTTNAIPIIGLNQFYGGLDIWNNIQIQDHILSNPLQFMALGTNVDVLALRTNFNTMFANVSPFDNMAFHIGGLGGGLPDLSGPGGAKLTIWGGAVPVGFTAGDSTISRRWSFISGGNANDTLGDLFANGTAHIGAQVGSEWVRDEVYAGHPGIASTLPFEIRDRNSVIMSKWALDGVFNVFSNSIFQGVINAVSNIVVGGSLTVSNGVNVYGPTTFWNLFSQAGQSNALLLAFNTNSLPAWYLGSNGIPVNLYAQDYTWIAQTPGAGVASTNYIDCSTNAVQYLTNLTVGSVWLHSTNRTAIIGGRPIVVLLCSSTNATYNLNTSWRVNGTNNSFYVASNKFVTLSLFPTGALETNMISSYGIQF